MVRLGAVFPQAEFDRVDPEELAGFATRIEEAGYDHLLLYDHVLGADTSNRPGWQGAYDLGDPFLEPLILISWLARTCGLDFVTGVLVLPQRQTAVVAKQVATLAALAPGRLRLGVGIGWNDVEYRSLGMDFSRRSARIEEQIPLLRQLWTDDSVSHSGPSDTIDAAGINPLPARPVPIWIGTGAHPNALARVGQLADGWLPMPNIQPDRGLAEAWAAVRSAAERAGRDPDTIGLEGQVWARDEDMEKVVSRAAGWQDAGAEAIVVNTLRAGLSWPGGHLDRLLRAADALR